MKPYSFLILSVAALSLTACGEKIAESVTEKIVETAVESSGDGAVDLDLNGDGFNLTTQEGTYKVGTNSELPSNFPSDVYQLEGKITGSLENSSDATYWVMIESDKSLKDVLELYKTNLTEKGWKITAEMNFESNATLAAEKEGRQLAVVATSSEGKTMVNLTENTIQ